MSRVRIVHVVAAALIGWSAPGAAQTTGPAEGGLPPLLPEAEEVRLARSAAPAEVSGDATVFVLHRGGYVVAEEGRNGITCFVDRSRPRSLEPQCFDAEGSATILRLFFRRAELREHGMTREEIDRRVAEELEAGRLRLPSRPAMSYMMSSAQELYSESGRSAGNWKPHLMLYIPYLTAEEIGFEDGSPVETVFLADPGEPTANILIIVPEFVDPEPVVP